MQHVGALRSAREEFTTECIDVRHERPEGRCDCLEGAVEGLRETIRDEAEGFAAKAKEIEEQFEKLWLTQEAIDEAEEYAHCVALQNLAGDVATIMSWGVEAGAIPIDLRCSVEDPDLAEMLRVIDITCIGGLMTPLSAFNDALNAIGPDQAVIAADTMRRWLEEQYGESSTVATPLHGDEEDVGEDATSPSPPVTEVPPCPELTPTPGGSSGAPEAGAASEGGEHMSASPSLAAFNQTLRPYQEAVLEDASIFLESCWEGTEPLRRVLYSAPTGTGKGTCQLALLKGLREQEVDAWILTPSLEVLRGFLERCGCDPADASAEKLATLGESIFCTTPVRARNRILEGVRGTPEVVIYDEVHHALASNDVSGTLFAVAPDAVWLGFTATPYRASPGATAALHADWGDPVEVLSIPEAVLGGFQALPSFKVVPLVDDDLVKVQSGEFQSKAATKAYGSRIEALADLIAEEVRAFPMPTAVSVPSSDVASLLVETLDARQVDAIWVHQGTKAVDRARAYAQCAAGEVVLLSIKVLNEGVDFPWLRQLIDARPTLSPVAWLQVLGRIMRPGKIAPRYICTNRNLERHAYLLQGAVPRSVVAEAQEAFVTPSKRAGIRQIGLEALRKFKAIPLPLDGGATGAMYCVYAIDDAGIKTEWVTLLDPTAADPFVARRRIAALAPGQERRPKDAYGKWVAEAIPLSFDGFATSSASGKLSEKMHAWWERDARRYGLSIREMDKLTRRQFQALPVLANCNMHLLGGIAK